MITKAREEETKPERERERRGRRVETEERRAFLSLDSENLSSLGLLQENGGAEEPMELGGNRV